MIDRTPEEEAYRDWFLYMMSKNNSQEIDYADMDSFCWCMPDELVTLLNCAEIGNYYKDYQEFKVMLIMNYPYKR